MITIHQLLEEMTDLHRLTYLPDPFYTCRQSSSYDRRSVAPDQPGWFANRDAGNYLRVTQDDGKPELVLHESDGPGCVTRIWSANPFGILRIYIDDLTEPAFEYDFRKLVEGQGPIPEPMVAIRGRGSNIYFPFIYAKRCRVTVYNEEEIAHGLFYHINYRTYSPNAIVQSFEPHDMDLHRDAIQATATRMAKAIHDVTGEQLHLTNTVAPDSRQTLAQFDGPAAISELQLKVQADDLDRAMRQTVLQIGFDDTPTPHVDAPIGDFFGCGPGAAAFRSIAFEAEADGTMICRFLMPFAKNAIIILQNRGSQQVDVSGHVVVSPYEWTHRSMHFRAKWRVNHDILASRCDDPDWPERAFPIYDWPYSITFGRGVYVGSSLAILNPTPLSSLYGGWWGEGDEKIYVDGEAFPSTFGTGSEDYFGYAWSRPEFFDHAYIAQPRCDGPGNRGYTVNSRWHVLDAIPFESSLEFYMELSHHSTIKGVSYGRLSYVYALPGARDDHVPLSDHDLDLPTAPEWSVAAYPTLADRHTLLEAEDADVTPDGEVDQHTRYSNGAARKWRVAAGQSVRISIPIAESGEYRLYTGLFAGPMRGHVALSLRPEEMSVEASEKTSKETSVDASEETTAETAAKQSIVLSQEGDLRAPLECLREIDLNTRPVPLEKGRYILELRPVLPGDTEDGHAHQEIALDYVRWIIEPK